MMMMMTRDAFVNVLSFMGRDTYRIYEHVRDRVKQSIIKATLL